MSTRRALLVSTYDLGRQPFGLASPAAWLRSAGVEVHCLDLSRDALDAAPPAPDLIGFYLPMHTATRLALPVIDRLRARYPEACLCAYGVYAPLNRALLRSRGVVHVLGGEFEADLARIAVGDVTAGIPITHTAGTVPRLDFQVPDRRGLPPASRYATLRRAGRQQRAGSTEASRGCKHYCRHCPIVPVYNGRFRVVPVDVVIEDVRRQVAEEGVRHITFGDPDFFNGIGHARQVMTAFARAFPDVTYDVTIKVEHLLRHTGHLDTLRDTGCLFVTSAVESFDDAIVERLRKGHTRDDARRALDACRQAGVLLAPTFVAFTPWTTLQGYCAFLQELDALDLIDQVASIQLAIRLLVPDGSLLRDDLDLRSRLGSFDAERLIYPWTNPDPRVDALGEQVGALVAQRQHAPRRAVFAEVWDLAHAALGVSMPRRDRPARDQDVPALSESWYCCAEPTADAMAPV